VNEILTISNETKPLAWLGDPGLKEEVVLRMKEHRAEDSIVQGYYQTYAPEMATQYKGCLLGCTLPQMKADNADEIVAWHHEVERLYGIPVPVAFLLENVFESLPFEEAANFAVESIEAIPVGADLAEVERYWFLEDESDASWSAMKEKDKVLDLLRNAPVPEPVQ
jgi:hypothetical protein